MSRVRPVLGWILAAVGALGFSAAALAHDLVLSRAVLADPSGTLTAGEVAQREFSPAGPGIALGYTNVVHWLRLVVRAPERGGEVALRIGAPYLDEVRLYIPDAVDPKDWRTRVVGDRYPFEARDRYSMALGFVVPATEPESTFYLRLKTSSTSLLSVQALEPDEAERLDREVDYLLVFFLAIMLALLLLGLQDFVATGHALPGQFCLFQAVYILYGLATLGYLAPVAPDDQPQLADGATSVLACAAPFAFALLSRTLFRAYAPPRQLAAGVDLLLAAFPLQLLAMASGYVREALWANMLLLVASRWYFVVMAYSLRQEQAPSRRAVRRVYLATALVVTVLMLPALGGPMLLESHLRDAGGLIITGLIYGSLFYLVLHTRSREMRATAQQTALDLLVTKKALEMEHALKERAEERARTDYLTGLASRRHFVELAERELARAERYRKPLTLLMIDLDFFKEVNDTRGHSVGDIVLQAIAGRIRDALREVDIVGRVGGEEFAAILVESEGAAAMEVAQRVRKAVGGSDITVPEGLPVRVTVSIGLTELRGREVNIDMLLAEADRALYAAKGSGRDSVRACEPD